MTRKVPAAPASSTASAPKTAGSRPRAKPAAKSAQDAKATAASAASPDAPASARKAARKSARPDRRAEIRREEILRSAFDVFAENGFAQARLDDIARRAGVAKGTIYLYFPDKETLFVELLREAARPVLGGMEALAARSDIPVRDVIRRVHEIFVKEILQTRRKHLLRLLIQEGPRFPAIADFYYCDFVRNGLDVIARIGQRGYESGELTTDALNRFPQILIAPLLMSVIWESLFEEHHHLDAESMLSAYRDMLAPAPDAVAPPDKGGPR